VVQRVVESAKEVDVEVKIPDELVTKTGIQADGHLVYNFGNDD